MEWALKEIGFEVMRISAGVMRVRAGDAQLGNHLCLLVCLDQPYLVDVGCGGSLAEPLPPSESERVDRPYHLGLSELDDGDWRFAKIAHGDAFLILPISSLVGIHQTCHFVPQWADTRYLKQVARPRPITCDAGERSGCRTGIACSRR
jgi:hypothetical protein